MATACSDNLRNKFLSKVFLITIGVCPSANVSCCAAHPKVCLHRRAICCVGRLERARHCRYCSLGLLRLRLSLQRLCSSPQYAIFSQAQAHSWRPHHTQERSAAFQVPNVAATRSLATTFMDWVETDAPLTHWAVRLRKTTKPRSRSWSVTLYLTSWLVCFQADFGKRLPPRGCR
jgi:hypothetical protein